MQAEDGKLHYHYGVDYLMSILVTDHMNQLFLISYHVDILYRL